jgi:hypothetical protein
VEKVFDQYEGLIFIMALGIVIRVIAPFIKSKHADPAVVVVDENRRFAISALSGHEGGANRLASQVATLLRAESVITTASETNKRLIVGVGCRKGTSQEEILEAIDQALKKGECSREDIRCIATIDLKGNEPGLREACIHLGLPLKIVPIDQIKSFRGPYQRSSFVKQKIGVEGERTLRTLGREKNKADRAQAQKKQGLRGHRQGRLRIVGIGPGDMDSLTPRAYQAVKKCQVIVGYTAYLKLLDTDPAGDRRGDPGRPKLIAGGLEALDSAGRAV